MARAGTASLSHRGPDAQGEWFDRGKGVYLGHRRLTVIDLSDASNQPMTRDGQVIAFNGEIYNYRSLRERLSGLGAVFTTTGDVEVLLRAWQHLGEKALDALDGMFAFVVWDGSKAHLVCDPFGEKTLYYAETKEGLYVSSELRSLAQLLELQPDLSSERLTPFISLGYVPAPDTFYPGIKRLLPAGIAGIQNGQLLFQRQYWVPPMPEARKGPLFPLSESDLDAVHERLVESVRGRLESDVPTCTFLSGGVDSVLIAAIAAKDLKRHSRCLTVGFPHGNIHDESEDARAIARHLQLDHLVVNNRDDRETVDCPYIFDLYGQPNDNISVAPVHQISEIAAQENFRVALTGMGGDELSLGYQKNEFAYKNRARYALPESLRQLAAIAFLPLQPLNDKFRIFRDVFGVPDSELYLALKNLPTIHLLKKLPSFTKWAEMEFGRDRCAFGTSVNSIDCTSTMPNSLLVSLDVASMRASVELRTPYLNRSLFELFATFDSRALLAFGRKSSLRRIAERYVPKEFFERPKRGFVYPQDRFLRHYGSVPRIDGINENLTEKVWRNRAEPGWRRLAVRLILASEFGRWSGLSESAAAST